MADSDSATAGVARSMADGPPLLPVQTEAGATRAVQPAPETGLHVDGCFRRGCGDHRHTSFPAGAVRVAGKAIGRFWDDPHLSFCGDDRTSLIRSGPPVDGGPARLVQFLFDV